jgi:DNA polymerase elongation subunit (family B)
VNNSVLISKDIKIRKLPLRLLNLRELKWLATHRCKHFHSFIEHINCFWENDYEKDDKLKEIKPRILIFDIEVSPHQGEYWSKNWETDIIAPLGYGRILCFAAKWLGHKKTFSIGGNNEERVVRKLWKLLNEADLLVGQNIKAFDIKFANSRFAFYGLPPISPHKVFDTRTEAKKYISLPSYRLNDIADYFGIGHKLEHEGLPLWHKCLNGDRQAWKRMLRYCRQDVELTYKVFQLLMPFVDNKAIFLNGGCAHCGSKNLKRRGLTLDGKFQRMQCQDCGGWSKQKV